LHVAAPLLTGAEHAEQLVPQVATAVLAAQMPLQLCVPVGHVLLQARLVAMQAPLQSCMPLGQLAPQLRPSQVADPPWGTAHAVHDVVPQLATSVLLTQAPVPDGHWWWPVAHMIPHVPPWQTAVPLGSPGQAVQLDPHAVASVLAAHLLPHR